MTCSWPMKFESARGKGLDDIIIFFFWKLIMAAITTVSVMMINLAINGAEWEGLINGIFFGGGRRRPWVTEKDRLFDYINYVLWLEGTSLDLFINIGFVWRIPRDSRGAQKLERISFLRILWIALKWCNTFRWWRDCLLLPSAFLLFLFRVSNRL